MTHSLRRSRRAPKRISDHNVGDIVEVSLEFLVCFMFPKSGFLDTTVWSFSNRSRWLFLCFFLVKTSPNWYFLFLD